MDQTPEDLTAVRGAFDDHLGLEMVEITAERVVARLVVTERHTQPYGLVHGGVYCAMAETVASFGAVLAIREMTGSDDAGSVGQSNHTDFLSSARGGVLTATATPVHVGRSVQLWRIGITDEDHRLVAESRVRMFNVGVERVTR
ncbi:PaaI family thioesterase [Euzebya sp.]|uniref:PaaI family thioesterase n=1 Tax=Euzebya sp. TaxID=1971409 RepID=UPI0035148694